MPDADARSMPLYKNNGAPNGFYAAALSFFAAARANLIREGSYDFALDEREEETLEEIPEELLESEEDKALDEAEEEKLKKIDKVLSWVWAALIVGIVAFMAWWLFF